MTAIVSSSLSMDQFNKAWPADPLGLLGRLRRDGPVSAIPFDDEDGQLVVAFHPPLISAALVHGQRTHRALLREYVGHGLFVAASGERWRRRRTLMHPLFTVRAASSRHGIVLDTTRDFLSRSDNRPFDLGHTMQRLSIEIILRLVDPALSGAELDTLATALQSAVEFLDQRLFRPDTVAPGQEDTFAEQKKLLDEFIETRVMSAGPN